MGIWILVGKIRTNEIPQLRRRLRYHGKNFSRILEEEIECRKEKRISTGIEEFEEEIGKIGVTQ